MDKLRSATIALLSKSSNDDEFQRRSSIIRMLLSGAIILSFISLTIVVLNGNGKNSESSFIIFLFCVIFSACYALVKSMYLNASIAIFVLMFFMVTIHSSLKWGIELPQTIIMYSILFSLIGIVTNSRLSIILSSIVAMTILALSIMQINNIYSIDIDWRKTSFYVQDAFVFVASYLILATISWLSNSQIEKSSLLRAKSSERDLIKERDGLEEKVLQRTREFELEQLKRIDTLRRFAEIGKQTSGLLHDLINPLTAVSLSLEHLSTKNTVVNQKETQEINNIISRAIKGTQRIENYVNIARKQLQQQNAIEIFNPCSEINDALKIINHRIVEHHIQVHVMKKGNNHLLGNSNKFYQVVINLLSNSIDALILSKKKTKSIIIGISEEKKVIKFYIKDNGVGIPPNIKDKIFNSFFTTKDKNDGMGLGLSLCENIIKTDFGGKIHVRSKEGVGSTFTIQIPKNLYSGKE